MGVIWTEEQQKVISLRKPEYSGKCSSRIRKNCRSCRTYFKQDLRS